MSNVESPPVQRRIGQTQAQSSKADSDLGARLFSFAVIADTHLNQAEDECNSPFEVNRLANARMRYVINDLNARQVDFVIHLGDLVHPVPAIPALYEQASARFWEQARGLSHRLHLVPGNHDVGDKPIDWGPAGVIREEYLALWREHFGDDYYAFEHAGCCFIVLNAQIINSGLEAEAAQRSWLEAYLEKNQGKRIFANIHYPPFLTFPDEEEHYDNIAEPGRSWLLGLLNEYGIEGLFAGHVHNFWYDRYGVTDCYLLPSTAFVRQDYFELFRAPPAADTEAGRNDRAKLGYLVIHVYDSGHVCEVVRSYGETVGPEARPAILSLKRETIHPRLNWRAPLGFDMRQNWMEVVEIPPSGGLDEFDRKQARNDYALMAIWELGVRRLRIPLRDLRREESRLRLRNLVRQSQVLTLFSHDRPDETISRLVRDNADLIDSWEVACPWSDIDEVSGAAAAVAREANIPLYISKLRSKQEIEGAGERYYHVINHGFSPEERADLEYLAARSGITGVVFRVPDKASPWEFAWSAVAACEPLGLRGSLHVRMIGANPASVTRDDRWAAHRVAEALFGAIANPALTAFIDTFADVDRGYFVRNGIVDRTYNPRLGFHVLRNLYEFLNRVDDALVAAEAPVAAGARALALEGRTVVHVLLLPDPDGIPPTAHLPFCSRGPAWDWTAIDLATGQPIAGKFIVSEGRLGRFVPGQRLKSPTLLSARLRNSESFELGR